MISWVSVNREVPAGVWVIVLFSFFLMVLGRKGFILLKLVTERDSLFFGKFTVHYGFPPVRY